MTVSPERVHGLHDHANPDGEYVLYWMQASQREECNHALEYAITRANRLGQPMVACFGLAPSYPDAALRHYLFMLPGLFETARALEERGILFVLRISPPDDLAIDLASSASLVVVDGGYLRIERDWRARVAGKVSCPLVEVESNVVVPVRAASEKLEWSAATIRPKIRRRLPEFLVPLERTVLGIPSLDLGIRGEPADDPASLLSGLSVRQEPGPVASFTGGTTAARERLSRFLDDGLDRYAEERNDPNAGALSGMSPYLHFGQISPVTIALAVRKTGHKDADVYLEELIVRRELSMNHVYHNPEYDRFSGLPGWALTTLAEHAGDTREYTYTAGEFERAETHDPYWNAAQMEMKKTGKMHGYMRMYWGKKILEWTDSPQEAFETALSLNNRYELDGRDPNGYTGVAWCFGRHDRAWKERPVYGKVRYMNAKGLARKFDADAYAERVEGLEG
ncbi:MAG: deoxyribodipyrimidine photo-lyase [Methanomicrobiaceae archaeon]|nr:deoxyribodipyrimidine photo-lyase [Methanomicrobiaceae archaeon]